MLNQAINFFASFAIFFLQLLQLIFSKSLKPRFFGDLQKKPFNAKY